MAATIRASFITCVALFFGTSLALTFFARGYLTGLAHDFLIDRTRRLSEPAVEAAALALQAPGIRKVLDDEAIQTARHEVDDYRQDPRAYVAKLVAGELPAVHAAAPGRDAPLRERVVRWKGRIREHFDRTLDRLLWDLRIFSGSNLAAALVAAWCALRARQGPVLWLLGVAGLLLASVAYGAYMYLDGFTYCRILFSTYVGWWYPALLGITFLGLYLEYGRREAAPPDPLPQPAAGHPSS